MCVYHLFKTELTFKECDMQGIITEFLEPILIHYAAITKIPQIGWLINNRNLFLTDPEAGKSKIKMLADSVSSEGLLPGS